MAENPLHDNPKSPKPKKYRDVLKGDEATKEFKKKPNKKVDDHEFENVDPRDKDAREVLDALPKYKKDHYDQGGDYGHWDKDSESGDRSYWEPVKPEKPMS